MSALPRNYTIMFRIHDNKVDNIAKHCFKRFKMLLLSLCFGEFQIRFNKHRVD